jgi:hypothetical protein
MLEAFQDGHMSILTSSALQQLIVALQTWPLAMESQVHCQFQSKDILTHSRTGDCTRCTTGCWRTSWDWHSTLAAAAAATVAAIAAVWLVATATDVLLTDSGWRWLGWSRRLVIRLCNRDGENASSEEDCGKVLGEMHVGLWFYFGRCKGRFDLSVMND